MCELFIYSSILQDACSLSHKDDCVFIWESVCVCVCSTHTHPYNTFFSHTYKHFFLKHTYTLNEEDSHKFHLFCRTPAASATKTTVSSSKYFVSAYVQACVCVCVYVCSLKYDEIISACVCMNMCVYIYVLSVYMIYIHTHTRTHAHTYEQRESSSASASRRCEGIHTEGPAHTYMHAYIYKLAH